MAKEPDKVELDKREMPSRRATDASLGSLSNNNALVTGDDLQEARGEHTIHLKVDDSGRAEFSIDESSAHKQNDRGFLTYQSLALDAPLLVHKRKLLTRFLDQSYRLKIHRHSVAGANYFEIPPRVKGESEYIDEGASERVFTSLENHMRRLDALFVENGPIDKKSLTEVDHEAIQHLIFATEIAFQIFKLVPARTSWSQYINLRLFKSEFELLFVEFESSIYRSFLKFHQGSMGKISDIDSKTESSISDIFTLVQKTYENAAVWDTWCAVKSKFVWHKLAIRDIIRELGGRSPLINPNKRTELGPGRRELEPIFSAKATPQEIGARIRAERVAQNLSQLALAERMGLTSKRTVQALEKGEQSQTIATILSAMDALDIDYF